MGITYNLFLDRLLLVRPCQDLQSGLVGWLALSLAHPRPLVRSNKRLGEKAER